MLKNKVADAKVHECSDEFASELQIILVKYQDCFPLRLVNDPSVDISPLKARLKDSAKIHYKARKYPQAHL